MGISFAVKGKIISSILGLREKNMGMGLIFLSVPDNRHKLFASCESIAALIIRVATFSSLG